MSRKAWQRGLVPSRGLHGCPANSLHLTHIGNGDMPPALHYCVVLRGKRGGATGKKDREGNGAVCCSGVESLDHIHSSSMTAPWRVQREWKGWVSASSHPQAQWSAGGREVTGKSSLSFAYSPGYRQCKLPHALMPSAPSLTHLCIHSFHRPSLRDRKRRVH